MITLPKQEYNLPVDYESLAPYERSIVRVHYTKLQKGLCMHCNQPLKSEPPKEITDKPINWNLFPNNFLQYPVHLQHCHNTGLTEGVVHSYCNAVMWQYYNK